MQHIQLLPKIRSYQSEYKEMVDYLYWFIE